eukprot:CAMPEP_0204518200 /NCGR_PEP_ID=MMETSP0661-20131031/4075_1 /ASSEMBLY_ACC=CAM_ASM_000606 /TAXON_ID=109239 /ORGANISM="Alexandrium margalefi, Strain AMGDE01CS-322" /LENGTH=77 /DNA_ID=CAMNT_0051523635 /DNA_START=162 /DNA_END=395 /DNA_ORIENTATION=+
MPHMASQSAAYVPASRASCAPRARAPHVRAAGAVQKTARPPVRLVAPLRAAVHKKDRRSHITAHGGAEAWEPKMQHI